MRFLRNYVTQHSDDKSAAALMVNGKPLLFSRKGEGGTYFMKETMPSTMFGYCEDRFPRELIFPEQRISMTTTEIVLEDGCTVAFLSLEELISYVQMIPLHLHF